MARKIALGLVSLLFFASLVGVFAQSCYDSDGGADYDNKGYVFIDNETYWDYCYDSTSTLVEYKCYYNDLMNRTEVRTDWYSCPYGCDDGVCLPEPPPPEPPPPEPNVTCADSDGGYDYHTKGTVTWDGYSITDICLDSQTILENLCYGNTVSNDTYTCPYGCSDGACLNQTLTCTDSDGGKDYYVKGTVTGDSYSITDMCVDSLGNYESAGNTLLEIYCDGNTVANETYDCPNGCKAGACMLSITVLSPNGGETWVKGNTYDITWESLGIEKVHIDVVHYGNTSHAFTLVSNIPASTGRYSWTIASKWPELPAGAGDSYKIRIFEYPFREFFHDESDNYFSIVEVPSEGTCTDYDDGKDYNVKGTVTWNGYSITDTCLDSQTLLENYCDGSTLANETYTCPYGCEDGACLPEPVACTYTDGGVICDNYFYNDYCEYTSSGEEYATIRVCEGGFEDCSSLVGANRILCPYGCSNGACLSASGKPDLTVNDIYLSNANPSIGDRVTFYVEIKNIGDAAADSCRARNTITPAQKQGINEGTPNEYYTDYTGSTYPVPQVYGKGLGPGEITTYNDYFNISSSSFEISTTVDIYNIIEESNENNNVLSKTFTVLGAVCPARIDIEFDKSVYFVGDTGTVKIRVYDSQGNLLPNQIVKVKAYLNGELFGPETTLSTGPTGVYASTGTFTDYIVGTLQYHARIDISSCGSISDSETVTVKEPPITISIPSVWSNKDYYTEDEKVTIYAKVVDNDGTPAEPGEGTMVTYSIYTMHTMEYNTETGYYESTIESPGEGFWRVHATAKKAGRVARNNDYYFKVVPLERFMKCAIFYPSNWETVSGMVRVHLNAKSDTRIAGMELAIKGEEMGIEMPLKECTSGSSGGIHYMDCYYNWDTSNFQGKVVLLLTAWNMNWERSVDSINLYVSEGEGFIGVEIESPRDGETVSGTRIIRAKAKSSAELTGMSLAIESENTGVGFPLSNCEHEASACPVGEVCKPVYGMTCEYGWDTSNYRGRKVRLSVTATNVNNQRADNDVTVYVGTVIEGWTEEEVRKAFEDIPLAKQYGLEITSQKGYEILDGINPVVVEIPVRRIVEPWKKYWVLGSEKKPPVYHLILEDASGPSPSEGEFLVFFNSRILENQTLPSGVIPLERAEEVLIEELELEKFDTEEAGLILLNFGGMMRQTAVLEISGIVATTASGGGGGGGMITGQVISSGGGGGGVIAPAPSGAGGGGGGAIGELAAYWVFKGTGIKPDGSTIKLEILMDARTGKILVGPTPDIEDIIRKLLEPGFSQLGLKISQIRQVPWEELEMAIREMRDMCEQIGPLDKGGIYWLVSDTEGVIKLIVRQGRVLQPVVIKRENPPTSLEIKQSIAEAEASAASAAEIKSIIAVPEKEAVPITGGIVAKPVTKTTPAVRETEIMPVLMIFDVNKLSELPGLNEYARQQIREVQEKSKDIIKNDLGAGDLKLYDLNMVMMYRTSYCPACPAGKTCEPCAPSFTKQFVYAKGLTGEEEPVKFAYILNYPGYDMLCKSTSGLEKNELNVHLWVSRKAVAPGDSIIVKSRVTDYQGNPVPNARVALTMGLLGGIYTCPACVVPADIKTKIANEKASTGISGGYACRPCVYEEEVIQAIVGETDKDGVWTYLLKIANIKSGEYELELRAEKGDASGSDKKVIMVKNIGPVENKIFKTIDLVRIVLKLETLNINILKLKPAAQGIANYYSSVGETGKAESWQEVVSSIEAISAHITDIKTAIKDLVDSPSAEKLADIKGGIIKIKKEMEDLLLHIIRVV